MRKWLILLAVCGAHAQQIYENRTLGARYEAPGGWAFNAPDTNSLGSVNIFPNRPGLNPYYCTIGIERFENEGAALFYPAAFAFFNTSKFFGKFGPDANASTLAYIKDTVISGIHYSTVEIRQVDADRVYTIFAASKGKLIQHFQYETTLDDKRVNGHLYDANWHGMEFIEPSTAKLGAQSKTQKAVRKELADLLGRRTTEPAATPRFPHPLR